MARLKCGWCGQDSDQAAKMIAGPGIYICGACVALCTNYATSASSATPGSIMVQCSFCGRKAETPLEKSLPGNRYHLCEQCLEFCNELLQTDSRPDESATRALRSALAQEWAKLVFNSTDDKQLFQQGIVWLRANKGMEIAGEAIAKLIEIKPTASVVKITQPWLAQFPISDSAPHIVGALLKMAPSPQVVGLAKQYIKSAEELFRVRWIVRAIIESPTHAGLYREIEKFLEKHPDDGYWDEALIASTKQTNKRLEKLVVRWLQLNVGNQRLLVNCQFRLAYSSKILEASFNWVRSRDRSDEILPYHIARLIRASGLCDHPIASPDLEFAREWLEANPDHLLTGQIFGSLVLATRAPADISNARIWYENHQANNCAWAVIADLLEYSYWHATEPDQWAVEQAQILLKQDNFRRQTPELVINLVGVRADKESIAWARETFERTGLLSALIRLLWQSADQETIAEAWTAYDSWKDSDIEPEMLYVLLKADPQNTLTLRRVRSWIKNNPKEKLTKVLAEMIDARKAAHSARNDVFLRASDGYRAGLFLKHFATVAIGLL